MRRRRQSSQLLRVEMLESRTLLAGTGFEAALAEVTPAVSGHGDFTFGFSERIGQSELFVTGTDTSALTINFDLLPAFVTAVSVANFDTVTFTGNDKLTKLVVTDVSTLDADGISISPSGYLYATNVETLSLASGGLVVAVGGDATRLEVADLNATTIVSSLNRLSIVSQSASLSIDVGANTAQTIKVFSQAKVSVSGLAPEALAKQVQLLPDGEPTTGGGTDPGTDPGTNPGNGGSGGVVTVTPDEQTSLLLARLREALLSGNTANVFAVLDSLEFTGNTLDGSASGIAAHLVAQSGHGHLSIEAVELPASLASSAPFIPRLPTLGELETKGELLSPAAPSFNDPGAWSDFGADFAGTGTFAPLASSLSVEEAETVFAGPLFRDQAQQMFLENLHDESRALRDIVLDGIAAQITPGEQTAYLLVDPKPSRANADRNRESSIDLYA